MAMKRKPRASDRRAKPAPAKKPARRAARAVKPAKPGRTGSQLEKVLMLIRAHPGIRPSEINRRLNLEQSDGPRATLIRRGLIRKQKDGSAVRYYVV
jgi:DNA-binding MarR family transcriptional regulator